MAAAGAAVTPPVATDARGSAGQTLLPDACAPRPVAHGSIPQIGTAWGLKWYLYAMQTTIDAAGRIVIPKTLRARLGFDAGRVIEVRERDGMLELEPVGTAMTLTRRGEGLVAVPDEPLPTLTDAMVRATLEGTRR